MIVAAYDRPLKHFNEMKFEDFRSWIKPHQNTTVVSWILTLKKKVKAPHPFFQAPWLSVTY
jgi:hypothetical protein